MDIHLPPDVARKLLNKDLANLVKRVQHGGKLSRNERSMLQNLATASGENAGPTHVPNMVELAAVLGVSRQSLNQWKKRKDAPKPAANGLHEVAQWREFMKRHDLKGSTTVVDEETALRARKLLAEVEERELKVENGEHDDETDFAFDGATPGDIANSDPGSLQRITGGKLVALKPNESLDSFEPKRPSPTFTGFLEHLRRDSALGMIPYEFAADSSKIGGAGVRLVVAKADRRFSFRQMILIQRLIKPVWFYVIGDAIDRGDLPNVPGWWKISCVTPRRVSVDAGREAQQNRADVEMGLKTISDHYEELGADFGEELERRARDAKMIIETAKRHGVPLEMLWKPSGGIPILPAQVSQSAESSSR